jgi:hypothetical protein
MPSPPFGLQAKTIVDLFFEMHNQSAIITAKRYLIVFFATFIGVSAVMATTGRLLPEPFGSYNPMDGIMRVEEVLQHATTAPPCVLVLGDSRAAFGINAASLGSKDCPGANYAFPALGIPQAVELARWAEKWRRPKTIVLSISDAMAFDPLGSRRGPANPSAFSREYWLRYRPIRWALLNLQRYQRLLSLRWPTDDGWSWNERLGRWNSSSLENRDPLDGHRAQTYIENVNAKSYYERRGVSVTLPVRLKKALSLLVKLTNRVVVVIPPQHPSFDRLAEQLAPGEQGKFRNMIFDAGKIFDLTVIDCLKPHRCGVHRTDFIDPVHISPKGAERLTAEIARRLG